jgi:hypothetical protein
MTEPSGRGESWEQRAAGLASEIQRWLIRTSARNMRDELGGQVKKAFRGSREDAGDAWATATTESPHAADEPPECAWCPLCRAARLIAHARTGADSRSGPKLSDAADMVAGAMHDALAGLDSILSYRPAEPGQPTATPESPHPATPEPHPATPEPPHAATPEPPLAATPEPHPATPEPPHPATPRRQSAAGGPPSGAPPAETSQSPAVKPADDPSEST